MVAFEQNVTAFLPYDRVQYSAHRNWYGFSFQLEGGYEGKKIDRTEYIQKYEPWFAHVVSRMDNGLNLSEDTEQSGNFRWIVNLDYEGACWFPNDEENLIALRTLFRQNNIPNSFKGALMLSKDNLLQFSRDLITYPFTIFYGERFLYNDLEISHSELPFVIKISAHRNIDLLSTDIELLKTFVNEAAAAPFIVRPYRGTAL